MLDALMQSRISFIKHSLAISFSFYSRTIVSRPSSIIRETELNKKCDENSGIHITYLTIQRLGCKGMSTGINEVGITYRTKYIFKKTAVLDQKPHAELAEK